MSCLFMERMCNCRICCYIFYEVRIDAMKSYRYDRIKRVTCCESDSKGIK
jgi:hypothetical protein